ncbi:SDR family oxidoreductase [Phytohabitans rumicis]|uniref:Nucleotide-diphosphate-sugar epimerase n=1 Tax=Phytohabitans rumicis TaxID=1076125 RepID=A0A6V8KUR3_9ACTN|nr:NAD(P)H-binding protein [Phytohabitans rumicis]GFJ87574.1 nucleotide-diphosphate-sugar epimerase [Phytohabitans rumicis]
MYLVTGATGLIGRPLIETLLAEGAEVRAVTRDPHNAGLPAGVEAVAPEAIHTALKDVRGLFVHPRATKDSIEELLRLAASQGVEKVVVMSAINVDDDPDHQPSRFNGDRNTEVERTVTGSGLPWVAVRPGSFAMNTLGMWRGQLTLGDTVRGPYAGFAEAVIHERDVAEVIARALLDDSLVGRRIPITGPKALRLDQMVPIIGSVLGRPLLFQEVPAELAAQGMIRNGLDEGFVRALMARYQREMQRSATVTDEVEKVLGRPARTFATWVADHKGAWS